MGSYTIALVTAFALGFTGCASNDGTDDPSTESDGGTSSTGGADANGGTSTAGQGGTAMTDGGTSATAGGSSAPGGTSSTGGGQSTGGTPTGGAGGSSGGTGAIGGTSTGGTGTGATGGTSEPTGELPSDCATDGPAFEYGSCSDVVAYLCEHDDPNTPDLPERGYYWNGERYSGCWALISCDALQAACGL